MCLPSQFKCPTNGSRLAHCISASGRCDGVPECPGGEDEVNCRKFPLNHISPSPVAPLTDGSSSSDKGGRTITISTSTTSSSNSVVQRLLTITAAVLTIALLITLVAFAHGFVDRLRKRRGFFSHRRMPGDGERLTNVEISNPMFGDGFDDDFDEDTSVLRSGLSPAGSVGSAAASFSLDVEDRVSDCVI